MYVQLFINYATSINLEDKTTKELTQYPNKFFYSYQSFTVWHKKTLLIRVGGRKASLDLPMLHVQC